MSAKAELKLIEDRNYGNSIYFTKFLKHFLNVKLLAINY